MPIDDAAWKQVRIAYCTSDLTVEEICTKFEIRNQTLYRRRLKEGWPKRGQNWTPPLPGAPPPPVPPPTAKTHATTSRAARAALILRLYNAIDLKLTQMEKLMSDPDATQQTTSADHEREARTLTGLVRNFERVTEMDADLTKPAGKLTAAKSTRAGNAASASPADGPVTFGPTAVTTAAALTADPAREEQLRREILQRFERIMEKRNPPGTAG